MWRTLDKVLRALRAQVGVWEWCAASVAALALALTFGVNYGVDNQPVYLLQALRLNDPGVLAKDWYAAQVTHYHPAFSYLAAPLLRWSPAGWGIGVALTCCIVLGCVGWYSVLRQLARARAIALAAFVLVLTLLHATETLSIAVSYIFNPAFQPSALGSLGLLLALGPFLAQRWLASGVLVACSGLFHANYFVLNVATFGLVHLFLGGDLRAIARRLVLQLAPSIVPLGVLIVPMLATVSAADAAEAQRILFQIRAPHHYFPRSFQRDLILPLGWTLLGLTSSLVLPQGRALRLARLWLVAASVVIWVPTLVTSISYWTRVAQLFVWRLAPFVDLLGQTLFCIAALRLCVAPRLWRKLGWAQGGLWGVALLALASAYALRDLQDVPKALLATAALPAVGAGFWAVRKQFKLHGSRLTWVSTLKAAALLCATAAVFVWLTLPELRTWRQQSNLFAGQPRVERELYDWVNQNTPRDATFLSPPEHNGFRFLAQRAIVVDWKSTPMLPGEILEWFRRLKDVTGRPGFNGHRDLEGYRDLSVERAKQLRQRYGFDYVLMVRGANARWQARPALFQNSRYVVYDARTL